MDCGFVFNRGCKDCAEYPRVPIDIGSLVGIETCGGMDGVDKCVERDESKVLSRDADAGGTAWLASGDILGEDTGLETLGGFRAI